MASDPAAKRHPCPPARPSAPPTPAPPNRPGYCRVEQWDWGSLCRLMSLSKKGPAESQGSM
eukprot:818513-Lingulodinium_polyedra.AAC.1